ncbi:macro domain-containing protein [Rhodococcus hoagii]|nr:macro domain-containing protein [Prescottella equi]
MLTTATGDLLHADVDALVNTVNTVGVMGKGIALQFRRTYPDMFKAYAAACNAGDVQLGRVHVWETGALDGPRFIVNFPTKGHWRSASKLGDIASGLTDLVRVIREHGITSIAVPPLGCGNGGLDWADVEPLIQRAFADLPDVDVRLYAPDAPPSRSAPHRSRSGSSGTSSSSSANR